MEFKYTGPISAKAVTGSILLSTLIACGGGSGGSTSPGSEQANTFSPDPAKLESSAEDSTALYVSESFTFSDMQKVHLTLNIYDPNGYASASTKVHIYALDEEYEEIEAVGDQRQLIAVGSTNSLGSYDTILETLPSTKQLLVTVDTLGIENVKIADVNESVALLFSSN